MSHDRKGTPAAQKSSSKATDKKESSTSKKRGRKEEDNEIDGSLNKVSEQSFSANTALTLFSPPYSTKKSRVVSPKVVRRKDYIEAFTPDQNELYEYLTETLTEVFFEAVLIAKGKVTLAESQSRARDLANVAAIAGGSYVPFVGGAISGISLLTYIVRQGLREREESIQRERLGKINTFVSGGPQRIWKISSEAAIFVCMVYEEQIEKLSTQGKQQFVSFIVGIMFEHIIKGCPRPASFLKKLGDGAEKFFKWILFKISPSLVWGEVDPEFVHPALSMLEALIFFAAVPGTRNRINVKEKFAAGMAFYIEGILQATIETPTGDLYTHKAAENKYGSRKLPLEYAKGLGYTHIINPSPIQQKHKYNFKRIELGTFCSYQNEKKFNGKFDKDLADRTLAVNGLRRGEATPAGNNCLLDTYFQLINNFFEKNHPNLILDDFQDFVSFIRERIDRNGQEMLSINDEEEGVRILLAVQEYIRIHCEGFLANFDLEVYVPDMEGDLAIVENIGQIQNQVNRFKGEHISMRVIQTNFNHYEPVFVGIEIPEKDNQVARRLSMN